MPKEFRLPDLGEGIHEGEIVEILVAVGDRVIDGQPVMLVETDKATTEVPAPVNGVVHEIRVKPGDVVEVGEVLMVFLEEGEEARGTEMPVARPEEPVGKASKETREPAAARVAATRAKEPGARGEAVAERAEGPVAAAPSTRKLARELGVDLYAVTPTGPGGRVTSEDVQAHADRMKKKPEEKGAVPLELERAPAPLGPPRIAPLPDFSQWGPVERIPLRSVRRTTAKHMALAWSQVPHVCHQDLADVTDLEAFRQRHKGEILMRGGALSLTVFILKAAAVALKAHPRFNASLDTEVEEIVLKHYYHIGVAVDTDRGLIVPVLRDVDRKSIPDLAVEIRALAERTREGKAERDEMVGGTFTVTNIGILGGTGFTPIVNFPQVAILGLGQARLQPVVKGKGESARIVPRLMLPLILGFDHRVVDGADAARFVNLIIQLLEDPERLLMDA